MRILFITQWFEPEPAFKGVAFAAALKARGHAVEVATAFPNYPGGKVYPGYRIRPYRRETMMGVLVHRLAIWPSHDRSSIGRIANYLSFFASVLLFGLLRGSRYDLVYVYHPPIMPAAAAAIFCRLYGRPLVVEIQDLWPDSVAASGMAGGRISALLGRLCDFVYRRAARIIPQSDRMRDRLLERGVPAAKLRRIYNWSTYSPAVGDDDMPVAVDDAFKDRFNIVYGGNLGQAQALDSLIDAAALASAHYASIHLHLFGNGIERAALAAHAERTAPRNVTLHGPVDRQVMDRIFDLADVLAVQLKDDALYTITIPSKVQHYLACGRPIVAGLSGEAADLLRASGAVILCPPQDVAAMANAICRIASMTPPERAAMGARGRQYYDVNMGFNRALDETIEVIAEAADRRIFDIRKT
jgi:glycosyltransferase involved in cell wall biosynthesis